jgi:hypothetical protein
VASTLNLPREDRVVKRYANGAIEVARLIRVADYATFVLAMWERNGGIEYVTWRVIDANTEKETYEHGVYFTDLAGATLSLYHRADKPILARVTPEMYKLAEGMARDYQDPRSNGIEQDSAYQLAALVIKGGK